MAFVGTEHKHTSKVFKCPECDIDPGRDVQLCVECRPAHVKSWHPPGMPDLSVTHGLEVFLRKKRWPAEVKAITEFMETLDKEDPEGRWKKRLSIQRALCEEVKEEFVPRWGHKRDHAVSPESRTTAQGQREQPIRYGSNCQEEEGYQESSKYEYSKEYRETP